MIYFMKEFSKMNGTKNIISTLCIILLLGCAMTEDEQSKISSTLFGKLPDGRNVTEYIIKNGQGATMSVIDLGGIIVSLKLPDRNGKIEDIVLGYDNPQQYWEESPYFGAIVGRYANRIANGRFMIEEVEYTLAQNNGPNALHGGLEGFDKKIWNAVPFENNQSAGVKFTLTSEDGDQGYPGTLTVSVTYTFDDENQLTVDYKATTDKATIINLSQHTYFNLNGHKNGNINDHEMMINASHNTPVDETLIPTGMIAPVQNTPMDFRTPKSIGHDIDNNFEQLIYGSGFDHNWVLDGENMKIAARVFAPKSGRVMEVYTDQPGIQFYTGNFLDNSTKGKESTLYPKRSGFCLETQHFPDSPNNENFPSTLLLPDEVFESKTVFKYFTSN